MGPFGSSLDVVVLADFVVVCSSEVSDSGSGITCCRLGNEVLDELPPDCSFGGFGATNNKLYLHFFVLFLFLNFWVIKIFISRFS